ncbi:Photosystem I chlorophyll a apoprotein A1 [Sesamum angolense]|uniref:Photosystem I chlorophyll a apoprotein A1 n=1 Tax=Sesamum angolense TaxID=2727404 RepID=A0AAE2C3S8_9LAMI|nr:Photosystem I chlorophyll a apoprotein A1 [Sesamum angolense]
MWIGGFLIVGAAAHAAIFMVRDYDPTTRYNDLLDRVLRHRDAIISHLNWACIFLGFHSFGLYIHNDTMSALDVLKICFQIPLYNYNPFCSMDTKHPLFSTGATAPGATASTSLTWGGVLFARSSRLIPDKANLGFRFPCDGLGRGASQVIQSYGSSLSAYGLFFLGAHFVRAFSLMFLFSGRGYWQELIESIVWAHNKLKVAPATQPRALSIVQGRVVGVTHYLLGGIATTWAFFLARIITVE